MKTLYCETGTATLIAVFDFFTISPLVHYVFLPLFFGTLSIALAALYVNRADQYSKYYAAICFAFLSLIIVKFLHWTTIFGPLAMYSWQLLNMAIAATALLMVFLLYAFIFKTRTKVYLHIVLLLLFLPIVLLTPTQLNITGFDLQTCTGLVHQIGLLYTTGYISTLMLVAVSISGIAYLWPAYTNVLPTKVLIISTSSCLFILTLLGTALATDTSHNQIPELSLFALSFISLLVIGFVCIRHEQFKIQTLWVGVSVLILLIILGCIVFSNSPLVIFVLAQFAFVLLAIFGYLFLRSIKIQVQQRLEIEKLQKQLKKANRKVRALDKTKSKFVSIASHQIRSPLTVIKGYASMLLDGSYGKVPAKAKEPLENIIISAKRMSSSVEDYLNVSHIESGTMSFTKEDFNFNDLVSQTADGLRRTGIQKGLLVTFKSSIKGKGVVNADVKKTKQVLHSLLDNALRYTKKGTVAIVVKTKTVDKKKIIYVEVMDTGIGINKDSQESIFDKFSRGANASDVSATGAGLGLYIAQQMARQMGGDVGVTSPGEGGGATFTFSLPLHF